MSRYRHMQVLEAVVQAGSLAAAARQLTLSPATIMRSIAALEARLKTPCCCAGCVASAWAQQASSLP